MSDPLVTILVPVYNEEKYLAAALESVRQQTFTNFKCLIGDNASTDNSETIYRDFIDKDSRFISYRNEENQGSYKNTATLYKKVDTTYLMLFAGHDIIAPTFLEKTIKVLETDPDVSMSFCRAMAIYDDETNKDPLPAAEYQFSQWHLLRYLQSVRHLGNCTIAQSVVRKNDLDDFVFPDTGHRAWDHNLISHLLWHGKVNYLPEHLYYRRYFRTRKSTYMGRITGKGDTTRDDYSGVINYYIKDIGRLYKGNRLLLILLQLYIFLTLSLLHLYLIFRKQQ